MDLSNVTLVSSLSVVVYSLIITFLTWSAIGSRQKKNEREWHLKKYSFVISSIYCCNFIKWEEDQTYPKNSCQLFMHLFIFLIPELLLVGFLYSLHFVMYCFAKIIIAIVTYLLGHRLNRHNQVVPVNVVAPWKYLLPLYLLWHIGYFYINPALESGKPLTAMTAEWSVYQNTLYILGKVHHVFAGLWYVMVLVCELLVKNLQTAFGVVGILFLLWVVRKTGLLSFARKRLCVDFF